MTDTNLEWTDIKATDVEQPEEPNIITIPSWNKGRFDEKLAKLNRKAEKWGMPIVNAEVIEEKSIIHPAYIDPDGRWKENEDQLPRITLVTIEIKGEGPKIEGWKFLGTLDHATLPGSVIVNTVPGESIPAELHNAPPICEHCNTKRIRNETFVLMDDAGKTKLVGRSCVRDFIGYDVKSMFSYLASISSFLDDFADDEDGWFGGGGHYQYTLDADKVLAVTAAVINQFGWVSRSRARDEWDGPGATADSVTYAMIPPKSTYPDAVKDWKNFREKLMLDNPKWTETAKAAREWLKGQEDNNEYMHNLHVIDNVETNSVPIRLMGYWCSVVSSYQRAMDKLKEAERQKKLNDWTGEVKKREDFRVKLVQVRASESYYGTSYMHKFIDEDGRTLIWWASSNPDLPQDEDIVIKATVKKHDEYNGWKQTIITRVKEVA